MSERKLKKVVVLTKRLSAKTHLIVSILFKKTYVCHYPDPENCQHYDKETNLCTDCNVKCSYRKKC